MTGTIVPGLPRSQYYGRRLTRPLRPQQQALVNDLLPRLDIAPPGDGGWLDPAALFGRQAPLWLEIGFGGGEHLADRARQNPAVNFIGVEPFINGVAKLLAAIDTHQLGNIRICRVDARLLLAALPDACVQRTFILYPDPWPKKRHNRRRMVSTPVLDQLARIMSPGAELRLATDDTDYARWMLAHLGPRDDFAWLAERPDDWRFRPLDQIETRYESKAKEADPAEGRVPCYLRYRRR